MQYKWFSKLELEDDVITTWLPLLYTETRIYRTIEDIKNYVNQSEHLLDPAVVDEAYGDIGDFISVAFSLEDKIKEEVDNYFGPQPVLPAYIDFTWFRTPVNMRYWYLTRGGRPLCGPRYRNILLEKEDFDCPTRVKPICMDLTAIIKKHVLRD